MLALLGLVATIILLVGLRWAIHRSLAPERIIETRTPADVGLQHRNVTIPTENGKILFGWFVPTRDRRQIPGGRASPRLGWQRRAPVAACPPAP